jgi:type I restriction enzyme S subunit
MRSNYKPLGKYIQLVDERNTTLEDLPLMGLSVSKVFFPTIANLIGTDMKTYKIVYRNQFTYIADTSRRGDKIAIALNDRFDKMLVSQAYTPFEIKDRNELDPEYLMMWFRRPEFDRYARFKSHGSAREIFDWEEMCNTLLPVPHIDKQREIVKEYNVIQNRIALNQQLIQKLEETAQAVFNSYFENKEESESHRLGDLIEIKGGFSYNSESLGQGNTYLLGMGCVSFNDRYIEDGMRLYSNNVPEQHVVKPKDIIIATRQQSENLPILGCPAMIPPNLADKKMVIASNLYRVMNKSKLSIEIVYQILKSKSYQEHIKLHTKGTTVGMITKDAIEDYVFEARSISFLYSIQDNINKVIDNVFLKRTESQKLTELKELLLSKLATI